MKTLAAILMVLPLSILKIIVLPNIDLIALIFICVVLDFVTGVIKSVVTGVSRTSKGYRKTIVKFTQYGVGCLVSMVLASAVQEDHTVAKKVTEFLSNGIYIFIIYIECTSILENAYLIDKKSKFSQYIIKPMLALLTFQLTKIPLILKGEEPELIEESNN